MLSKVKQSLELSSTTFDTEISDYIEAGIADLESVGVYVPVVRNATTSAVTSVLDTEIGTRARLIEMAIRTYVQAEFSQAHGYPGNYQQIVDSYEKQKAHLRLSNNDIGD